MAIRQVMIAFSTARLKAWSIAISGLLTAAFESAKVLGFLGFANLEGSK